MQHSGESNFVLFGCDADIISAVKKTDVKREEPKKFEGLQAEATSAGEALKESVSTANMHKVADNENEDVISHLGAALDYADALWDHVVVYHLNKSFVKSNKVATAEEKDQVKEAVNKSYTKLTDTRVQVLKKQMSKTCLPKLTNNAKSSLNTSSSIRNQLWRVYCYAMRHLAQRAKLEQVQSNCQSNGSLQRCRPRSNC